MKIINTSLLDSLSEKACMNSRLRANHNFHESLDDPINRLLNAMEPGTYVPPHRHINPDKEEVFLVLRGSVLLIIFDDEGTVEKLIEVSSSSGVYGSEIEPGAWHSLIVLDPGTVIYEIKRGPYAPISTENIASWAPKPDDKEGIAKYLSDILQKHRSLS